MDGFAEGFGPEFDEKYRQLIEELEAAARRIGLYLHAATVASSPEGESKLIVMVAFDIGELAWRDPEVDSIVRGMDDDLDQAKLEEMRQEYLKRRGGSHES